MDPFLTGALIMGGASLLGGLFGSSSASKANEQNAQLARETNQQQREMFNESMAFQNDMFDKTNAWNTPANQVKLLQQAGINPGAVYGSGSTADATPLSAPGTPTLHTPEVKPLDYSWIPNSIDMGVNAYFNNQMMNSEVEKRHADSQIAKFQAEFDAKTLESRCLKVINDSQSSSYAKEQAKITLDVLAQTKRDTISQAQWSTKIMEQEYDKAFNSICESKLRQEAQRIANQYAPKMSEAQLKQYHANVSAAYAAARASDASAADSYAHEAVNNIVAVGGKIDNQQKKIMFSSIYKKAQEEAKQAEEATKQMRSKTKSGEVRTRLIGAEPQNFEISNPFKIPFAKKFDDAYKRGVKKGMQKKNRKSDW